MTFAELMFGDFATYDIVILLGMGIKAQEAATCLFHRLSRPVGKHEGQELFGLHYTHCTLSFTCVCVCACHSAVPFTQVMKVQILDLLRL